MKKALIAPNEPVQLADEKIGWRVAQVESSDKIFSVADPLFWVDCADDVVADRFFYDEFSETITPIPSQTRKSIGNAPNVIA